MNAARFLSTRGVATRRPPVEQRRKLMKRVLMLALLGMFSAGMLSACNTVAGAGKDMQKAGEKVEDKAHDCRDGKC